MRQSFAGEAPKFLRPVELEVHGVTGQALSLIARDELAHVVRVESLMPLAKAEKAPLSDEKLREQLGRLGGTPFKLGAFKNFLSGQVMLPVSELNRLRREAVAGLETLRAQPRRWQLSDVRNVGRRAERKYRGFAALGRTPPLKLNWSSWSAASSSSKPP